jgi:hypothetical protein
MEAAGRSVTFLFATVRMNGASNNMSPDRSEIEELEHRYCDALCQRDRDGEAQVGGDTARGRWYITEYGLTTKGRRTFYIAHYDDDYLRTTEGWRFARSPRRDVTLSW